MSLPFLRGTGDDSVAIDREPEEAEQSLRALSSDTKSQGSRLGAGAALPTDPAGRPYVVTGLTPGLKTAAAKIPAGGAQPEGGPSESSRSSEGGAGNLAEALKSVSDSKPGESRAGRAARLKPFASLGSFSNGSSAAEAGSGPGAASSAGESLPQTVPGFGARRPSGSLRSGFGRGQSFGALEQSANLSNKALMSKDEIAAHFGKKAFDLAPARAAAIIAQPQEGASGPPKIKGNIPASLSSGEEEVASEKFVPPDVGPASETKDKSQQYMEQQFLMMILAVSLGGFLGPALGTAGVELVRSYGLNPPAGNALSRVGNDNGG